LHDDAVSDAVGMRNNRKLLIGLTLSAAALIIMISRIDWAATGAAIYHADVSYIVLGFVLFNIGLVLRAWRWSLLVRAVIPDVRLGTCYAFFMIGNLANLLLPMRAGDFARSVLMGKRHGVSGMGILTTVAVERVFDIFVILGIAVALLMPFGFPAQFSVLLPVLATISSAMMIIMWGLSHSQRMQYLLRRTLAKAPYVGARLDTWVAEIIVALSIFRNGRAFAVVVGASLLVWLPSYFVIQSFLLASGIDLPASAPLVVLVVTVLGLAVPTVPGNIGVAHLLYASAAILYGVEESQAYAFAILLHAVPHLWMIIVGLIAMWRYGMSFDELPKLTHRTSD